MAMIQANSFIPFLFPNVAALGIADRHGKKLGQKIPKETIYQQANPTTAVKQLFVQQVEQITWRFKLSASTLNVATSELVTEIQVFDIHLKADCDELDRQVLETLDKAIPSNIFYRIWSANKNRPQLRCAMAYKRANKRDGDSMVVQDYFISERVATESDADSVKTNRKLPVVLNMAGLYTELLRSLLPVHALANESIDEQLNRIGKLKKQQGQLNKLQAKQRKEKQFNRKVEMNKQINQLKQQIQALCSAE